MTSLRLLIPLLVTAGILLAGNGLQGTLIALRGSSEGFSPTTIGLVGSAYYAGFLLACLYVPRLLQAVGHIRSFAALAAIAASGTLLLVLLVDPVSWAVLRFIMGFCFSALFATVESWLNSSINNSSRGKVLSLYRLIDLVVVTGAQFLIPVVGFEGFELFAIVAMMIALSLVPVALKDRSHPKPPESFKFDVGLIWRLSPIACLGCISIGLTNSAFRLVGPIYAQEIGLSVTDVATFMSAGILGGTVLQYPFGMMSDRFDRRFALILATLGASASGMFITLFAGTSPTLNYIGIFAFGAFALPLYSLSAAHANDHAKGGEYVAVAAGLIFFFSLGAIIGPMISSVLIKHYGAQALFSYTSAVHIVLVFLTLWRMRSRDAVPAESRGKFVSLLRTSPQMNKLAKKSKRKA